jgi:hypothetical protein
MWKIPVKNTRNAEIITNTFIRRSLCSLIPIYLMIVLLRFSLQMIADDEIRIGVRSFTALLSKLIGQGVHKVVIGDQVVLHLSIQVFAMLPVFVV